MKREMDERILIYTLMPFSSFVFIVTRNCILNWLLLKYWIRNLRFIPGRGYKFPSSSICYYWKLPLKPSVGWPLWRWTWVEGAKRKNDAIYCNQRQALAYQTNEGDYINYNFDFSLSLNFSLETTLCFSFLSGTMASACVYDIASLAMCLAWMQPKVCWK